MRSSSLEIDRRYMRRALALARAMVGRTSPNPSVGCVIVRGTRIVGRGVTGAGGRPHGEANALDQAGARARGATAYVTLEPCAHFGKTPPCAEALVAAGVRRVAVACGDPDPRVSGRGIAILRRAGISVTTGILADEARALNKGFITRVNHGRPLGILKLAMSLDGRIAAASGDSRWISSPQSRAIVHRMRSECDAVMVGAGTVIADNPRLTCRIPGGRDPVRVIIDGNLRTPPAARIFHHRSKAPTILVTTPRNLARARRKYARRGVEVIAAPGRPGKSTVALGALMREFGGRGWRSVLVEGGSVLAGSALGAGIIDSVAIFVAPKIIGAGTPAIDGTAIRRIQNAIALTDLSARRVGSDWLFEGRIKRRPKSRLARRQ